MVITRKGHSWNLFQDPLTRKVIKREDWEKRYYQKYLESSGIGEPTTAPSEERPEGVMFTDFDALENLNPPVPKKKQKPSKVLHNDQLLSKTKIGTNVYLNEKALGRLNRFTYRLIGFKNSLAVLRRNETVRSWKRQAPLICVKASRTVTAILNK